MTALPGIVSLCGISPDLCQPPSSKACFPIDSVNTNSNRIHACVLGPPVEHREALLLSLGTFCERVEWLPDFDTFLGGQGRVRSRPQRFVDLTYGIRDRQYLELLDAKVRAVRPAVMVAYWGTVPLSEIFTWRARYQGIRIALVLLCYPLGLRSAEIVRQNFALRRAARAVDAIVCPTVEMADYLRTQVLRPPLPLLASIAPCWPREFLANERSPAFTSVPNVLFAGRTDFSSKTIQPADDVREEMMQVMDAGIELFHARSRAELSPHRRRHVFDPLTVRDLIARMSAHDASLMMYSLKACARTDRFELTVPDRLISSVAAGVPIAIERNGYSASKSYLARYGSAIEYDDWHDLYRQLTDRGRVHALQEEAWERKEWYTAEARGPDYRALVQAIL